MSGEQVYLRPRHFASEKVFDKNRLRNSIHLKCLTILQQDMTILLKNILRYHFNKPFEIFYGCYTFLKYKNIVLFALKDLRSKLMSELTNYLLYN